MAIVLIQTAGNESFRKRGSNKTENGNCSIRGRKMETEEKEIFKTQQRKIE